MKPARPTQATVRISLLREDGTEIDASGYEALERRMNIKWHGQETFSLSEPGGETATQLGKMGRGYSFSTEEINEWNEWISLSWFSRACRIFSAPKRWELEFWHRDDTFHKVSIEFLSDGLIGEGGVADVTSVLTNGGRVALQWGNKIPFEVVA